MDEWMKESNLDKGDPGKQGEGQNFGVISTAEKAQRQEH